MDQERRHHQEKALPTSPSYKADMPRLTRKKRNLTRHGLMPVILPTQEVETGKIEI
jgi:hypothetical protein